MAIAEKKIQIYLPKNQYKTVRQLAHQKHTSFAQIVREALNSLVRRDQNRWDHDPISPYIGFIDGPKDLSTNHDHYIYDDEP
jgi:hypothetical protein